MSLKGVTLTWYEGSHRHFGTLVKRFDSQYATSRSHCMTTAALVSLWQADDESLRKFMDRFRWIVLHIRNLNPEVALHSMLLALRHGKFTDSLCKKTPNSMDELREQAKGYIQMKEMFRFRNEVWQAGQKPDKRERGTKTESCKSDERHKPNKRQPLPRGPRYKRYTPLMANRTTILEETFNAEVPIKLTPPFPSKFRLNRTKHYRYHCSYGQNTEDCWALKDKIEELIQARYLAQFVKRLTITSRSKTRKTPRGPTQKSR